MDNSKYYDPDPPSCMLILIIILFCHQKVSLMVIINIKVYKRIHFVRDHVTYVYTFMYIHMY